VRVRVLFFNDLIFIFIFIGSPLCLRNDFHVTRTCVFMHLRLGLYVGLCVFGRMKPPRYIFTVKASNRSNDSRELESIAYDHFVRSSFDLSNIEQQHQTARESRAVAIRDDLREVN